MNHRRIPKHLLIHPYPQPKQRTWHWWLLAFSILTLSIFIATSANAQNMESPESGVLSLRNENNQSFPSTLINTEVSAEISGMVSSVEYRQKFVNNSDEWVEGIYMFPLPENAAVQAMEIRIGERVIIGEIKEKREAKRIYQKAKAQGKRAALTSQQRPNLFTQRVANIGPKEEIEVRIQFLDIARYQNGQFEWRLPTTLTPRYIPGHPISNEAMIASNKTKEGDTIDSKNLENEELKSIHKPSFESNLSTSFFGWATPTNEVPDAHLITPPMTNSKNQSTNTLTLDIKLNSGMNLSKISSSYHDITTRKESKSHHIQLSNENEKMNRDFVLQWQPVASDTPTAAAFTQEIENENFTMLMLMPPNNQNTSSFERDIIFVIDTSGSMQGSSINEAKASLRFALQNLSPKDNFNIIEFNSSFRSLFNQTQPSNQHTLDQADKWISSLRADGGTEMYGALSEAFNQIDSSETLKQIVFITDGAIGNESSLFKLITDRLKDARLFTVGIGSAPNSYFMKKAAQFGRGSYEYIAQASDIQDNMNNLIQKLNGAVAKNISVQWPAGAEPYPKRIGDIYKNEPLISIAKTDTLPKSILVNGQTTSINWKREILLPKKSNASGISTLWARKKIESIEDEGRSGTLSQEEVKSGVLKLALTHKLLSRFTSFVAVDKTPVRMQNQQLHTRPLPNQIAKGQKLQAVMYPKTASTAEFSFWLGLFFLMALIVYKRMNSDI